MSDCRVHFIERMGLLRPTDHGGDVYESGCWKVTDETARALVGGSIYFHKKQAESSFFGGRILSFRIEPQGEYARRVVFQFRYERCCKGFDAGRDAWSMAMKVVLK